MTSHFVCVTEMPGDLVSEEQIERTCHRYLWAGSYCKAKDVAEAGCGPGQGLGYLAKQARSLRAGDYAEEMVIRASAHYGDRIMLQRFDAQDLPFEDRSLDVILLFEAIYYLPSPERFVAESKRVLRPGGCVLVASANKDLYDFAPSQHSVRYLGVPDLTALFSSQGYTVECLGYLSVQSVSTRQRILRPAKAVASKLALIPKAMKGKKLLKRLVFGKLRPMPAEIEESMIRYQPPTPIANDLADTRHKVIYWAARLNNVA